jgi:hypothetical protein
MEINFELEERKTLLNIVAMVAVQSWARWTIGEIEGNHLMIDIMKLEEVLLKEGYIERKLSTVFQAIMNYNEKMILKEEELNGIDDELIGEVPEIIVAALEFQKGDRCIVGGEEILDSKDMVKESFKRSEEERRLLFIQRRRRRRKEYRKRKKLKHKVMIVQEELIDRYNPKVKRKKAPDIIEKEIVKKKPPDKGHTKTRRRKITELIYGKILLVNQHSSPRNILCKGFIKSAGHQVRSLWSTKAIINMLSILFVWFMKSSELKTRKMLVTSSLQPTSATNPPPGVGA